MLRYVRRCYHFFSGFGVGTILTPVFIIFFPIDIAIAMTAIVHFLNNVFKFGMTYKSIEETILDHVQQIINDGLVK